MILRPWQNNLIIRERKIIWVEDNKGCTGKSRFQKWLNIT